MGKNLGKVEKNLNFLQIYEKLGEFGENFALNLGNLG